MLFEIFAVPDVAIQALSHQAARCWIRCHMITALAKRNACPDKPRQRGRLYGNYEQGRREERPREHEAKKTADHSKIAKDRQGKSA